MTSLTPDELRERLEEVLARVRDGETFAIVADDRVIAGILPAEQVRLQVDRHERRDDLDEAPSRSPRESAGPRRANADEAALERLRDELERTRD